MAYGFITEAAAQGTINGVTTGGVNTSGGTLLVQSAGFYGVASGSFSDSKGNTWVPRTISYHVASGSACRIADVQAPTVGSGHTFGFNGTGTYPSTVAAAFSGSAASAFDQENGATATTSTIATGSVTPSEDNELLFAGLCHNDSTTAPTIDTGFTRIDYALALGGTCFGAAAAYKIQTTAGSANPTFDAHASAAEAARIATYKAAAAGSHTLSGALVEAADAAALAAGVRVSGLIAVTEGADAAALATKARVSGLIAVTEGADAAAIAAKVEISGTLAVTEGADAAAIAASTVFSNALVEAADASAIAGGVRVSGTLALGEASDLAAILGRVRASGQLALIEGADMVRAGDPAARHAGSVMLLGVGG
jgi:hypothetical protein